MRDAIDTADVDTLSALVAADPALADADIAFGPNGKNVVPPLHYVCDVVFRRLVTGEQALAMANVLLDAGVDPDRAYAKSGDTFLIAAASLGAELVGLRLVEAGADVTRRGLFGATALHWCAIMGLERLGAALAAHSGAELELRDTQYDCTPLEWALHGWIEGTNGYKEGIPGTTRALVERGAVVPPRALENLAAEADVPMRQALAPGAAGPS